MRSMDFPDVGMGEPSRPAVDMSDLKGSPGDTYLKCGKCQACYAVDIEVKEYTRAAHTLVYGIH